MTTEDEPTFLSSLPDHPITDDIMKQIGESDHPKIRGAMRFPGAEPRKVEGFLLEMELKTHVVVFDPTQEQWRLYASFENEEMSHDEIIERASELYNQWLTESLSDRIAAEDESDN